MRCPECDSTRIDVKFGSAPGAPPECVKCNDCGYQELDAKIGGTTNCRCPRCASTEVDMRYVSAQSGNTDWVTLSCNKCGLHSGILDDQKYESDCEWYDPSKYAWIAEIPKDLEKSTSRKPEPESEATSRTITRARTPLSEWYVVSFDSARVYRRASPPGAATWDDSFAWADVVRVCYEPSDFLTSDTFYIFVKDRPESFAIPSEAKGATELWGEIIHRGLFDAETSIKISSGQLGLSCWPPIDG